MKKQKSLHLQSVKITKPLKTAIDKALEEMKSEGVIDEIFDHWFVSEE